MAAYEVLLLNTTVPQIQAAQAGDTYVVPRNIAVNAQMTVTGNVGIGTTSPTQRLDVSMLNSGASGTVAVFRNAGTSTVDTAARIVLTSRSGDEIRGSYIEAINVGGANYPFDLVFGTSSSNSAPNEKMRIDSTGNVGIGTTSPDYKLQVSGTTGQTFSIERVASSIGSSTALGTIAATGEIPTLTADGASIQFLGAGTWSATSSPGRIIFNTTPAATTTPVERFQLAAGEAVFNDPGNDYDFRVESDTNTHALFVDAGNSRVGVGEDAPLGTLHTSFSNSGTYSSSSASITTPAGTEFIVQNTSNTTGAGAFLSLRATNSSGTVNYAYMGAVSNAGSHSPEIVFGQRTNATAYAERLRIKSAGQTRFVPLAADPAGAEAGDVYYNSGTNKLRLYDGTSWVDLN